MKLFACATAGFTTGLMLTTVVPIGARAEAFSLQSEEKHASSNVRMFGSDAGLVLNFIKPDKTTDFEAVIAKVKEALQKSARPERDVEALYKQYAESYATR